MDALPLQLKRLLTTRDNSWFELVEKDRLLYLQFNAVCDARGESFEAFNRRLWNFYHQNREKVEKLVVDLRYNGGGNGNLLRPLIHSLIKEDAINQRGMLFVITGAGTFSAAVSWIARMREHTEVIVVGEPAAGRLNWCSDVTSLRLGCR